MAERKRRVLHLFEVYLNNAQNWAFRMLDNYQDTENYVSAYFFHNDQFLTPKIKVLEHPPYVGSYLINEGNSSEEASGLVQKVISRTKAKALQAEFLLHIASQVRKHKIDIIHCHFAHIGWHFLPLKKLTGKPFIVSFYGFDYQSLPYSFPEWRERYNQLFEEADLFICEGAFGASSLISQGCPSSKIKVVHLGVDFEKIPSLKRTKNPNELSLVQVSNFAQKKGHIYTLMAFHKALQHCPNMKLMIVGDGNPELEQKLKDYISKHQLENVVAIKHIVPSTELYDFLQAYQVFIQPSCYADNRDCEGGAPIVLLDAQATGMPVISTYHCDIPEEVLHGKTGMLSIEKDVDSLANSIMKFYVMDNDSYQRFAEASRNHVNEYYNVKFTARSMETVYEHSVETARKFSKSQVLLFVIINKFNSLVRRLNRVYTGMDLKAMYYKPSVINEEVIPILPAFFNSL